MVRYFTGAFKRKSRGAVHPADIQPFSTFLTEVNTYVRKVGGAPAISTLLHIKQNNKELTAFDSEGNEMGNLPSRYSHLSEYIEQGYFFTARVTASSINPFVSIIIDVIPQAPAM